MGGVPGISAVPGLKPPPPLKPPPLVKKSQIGQNPRNPGFGPIWGLSACGGEKIFYILLLKYNDFPLKTIKIRYFFAPAAREKNRYFNDSQRGNTSF